MVRNEKYRQNVNVAKIFILFYPSQLKSGIKIHSKSSPKAPQKDPKLVKNVWIFLFPLCLKSQSGKSFFGVKNVMTTVNYQHSWFLLGRMLIAFKGSLFSWAWKKFPNFPLMSASKKARVFPLSQRFQTRDRRKLTYSKELIILRPKTLFANSVFLQVYENREN